MLPRVDVAMSLEWSPPLALTKAFGPVDGWLVGFHTEIGGGQDGCDMRVLSWALNYRGSTEEKVRFPEEEGRADSLWQLFEFGTRRGGLLVCHDLACHSAVVAKELRRCQLTHMGKHWAAVVGRGLCLMDPALSEHTEQMQTMARQASPGCSFPRTALSSVRLARELRRLSRPMCSRTGTGHKRAIVFPDGIRDNGDFEVRCRVCGDAMDG